MEKNMKKHSVVMQSDFGLDSGLVSCMHGIVKRVDSELEIYDISHIIRPFDIEQASEILPYTVICWPEGTVFVSVVDPGVGTARRACVAKTANGYYVVGPDNGMLTWLDALYGISEVREIDEKTNRYDGSEYVSVFHGRDMFAYVAAKLASGIISFEQVGEAYPVEQIVRHKMHPYEVSIGRAAGVVTGDPDNCFGTMVTNIPNVDFAKTGINFGDRVRLTLTAEGETIFDENITYGRTFGDVAPGQPILHPEIATFLGFSVNLGNFAAKYGVRAGQTYQLTIQKDG
jgi:hypothetical protein